MLGAMLSGPTEPNNRTLPSAGPVAVYWWAMLPPAPALFSTVTATPKFSPSFLAMMRAPVSAAPPGTKPTTMLMVFLGGKSCATAWPVVMTEAAPSTRPNKTWRRRWVRDTWAFFDMVLT